MITSAKDAGRVPGRHGANLRCSSDPQCTAAGRAPGRRRRRQGTHSGRNYLQAVKVFEDAWDRFIPYFSFTGPGHKLTKHAFTPTRLVEGKRVAGWREALKELTQAYPGRIR